MASTEERARAIEKQADKLDAYAQGILKSGCPVDLTVRDSRGVRRNYNFRNITAVDLTSDAKALRIIAKKLRSNNL